MAANEQVTAVSVSKKLCNYCKNSTKSGPSCCVCGASYHPSCAQRVKVCCGAEVQTRLEEVSSATSTAIMEILFLKEENKLLKQMISDKEVNIKDKSEIICLLQQKIAILESKLKTGNVEKKQGNSNTDKNSGALEKQTYADKIKTDNTQVESIKDKKYAVKTNGENSNLKMMQDKQMDIMQSVINLASGESNENLGKKEGEWISTNTKKKRTKKIGEVENSGKFKGLDPKVWMYIYRVRPEVSVDDIKEYLADKTGDEETNFDVKFLKITKGNLKCFMVAADFKFKSDFYNRSFWPKGVGYRRFDFRTDNITEDRKEQTNSFLERKSSTNNNAMKA